MYKVNEVATIAGVSVRTLHHYDAIGLLAPAVVEKNGYRLYSDDDLARLQQILFFKELDFPLQRIRDILDNPSFDHRSALHAHRELLVEKKRRLEKILLSVERSIQSMDGGEQMSKKEMFEPFDMSEIEEHRKKYEQETRERYGDSDAYKESQRRTSAYTKEDWQRVQSEMDQIFRQIGEAAEQGNGPGDAEVQQYVGQLRAFITANYYNCTLDIFRGLGDLYVGDERFTANLDRYGDGLASFLRDAMHMYCDRLSSNE